MTQVVTVQTDFADLNQMTQGLMERVHETHVILTGPDDINEGEWVQFAVNLHDGTPGFAGVGRCVRSVDNGEARMAHQRFDLVLDSLQFDQHGQDVYQYILMSRQAALGDGPAAEEAQPAEPVHSGSAAMEASEEDLYDAAPGTAAGDEGQALYAEDSDSVQSVDLHDIGDAAEAAEADAYSEPPSMVAPDEVVETSVSDIPPVEPAEPMPLTHQGPRKFVYTQGLPIPDAPPRPDLDPSLRVTPAPRPSEGGAQDAADAADDPFEQSRLQEASDNDQDGGYRNGSPIESGTGYEPVDDAFEPLAAEDESTTAR